MSLRVGAGKACINPTPDMLPIPSKHKDWGTAPITPEAIYDDINCRAIAIDTGKDQVLLVSYDLIGYPHVPQLAAKLAAATGFPEDNIIISGTHNHSGCHDHMKASETDDKILAFQEKYKEIELAGGIAACKQAVESMRPAKYGYGETLSYVNTNRDTLTPGGYWVEVRNLAAYSDKTLAIIKFVDMEGKLIAAYLNHGTHNTNIYMMKDFDGKAKISGNFSGIACRFVEEHYGDGAVCLWTSGAAGNQNPLLSHGMQYEYPDGYTTSVPQPDGVGFMQMELMGRTHGADAVRGIDEISRYSENMPVVHVRHDVPLQGQMHESGSREKIVFRMGGNGLRDWDEIPYGQLPQPVIPVMVDDNEHPAILKMQLLILGDIAMVCAAAELYAEIGRDMKAASPYKKTFVVTHTDPASVGYILDKNSKDHIVFQAFNRIKPGTSDERILEGQKELFKKALNR